MRLRLLAILAAVFVSSVSVQAETQRLKAKPDSQIIFDVSVSGPTRISVEGDRISKILQSNSAFEMSNDEGTGDVFLRFAGGREARSESGYIVTEAGHTIGFVMHPKTGIATQTVLITLTGVPSSKADASPDSGSSKAGFEVNQGSSSTRAGSLAQVVRATFQRGIGERSPASRQVGRQGTYTVSGYTARVEVARAVSGRPPAHQSFYRSSRTLAVWVDDRVAGGKVWVIVVEGRG